MLVLSYITFAIYISSLLMIFIYSLTQLNMLRYLLKHKKEKKKKPLLPSKLPKVTVQLPLYNEYYVVERLLKCITALEYK